MAYRIYEKAGNMSFLHSVILLNSAITLFHNPMVLNNKFSQISLHPHDPYTGSSVSRNIQ